MSSGIMQAQANEQAQTTGQSSAIGQPDQLTPMTAESAQRLAAILAPHLMAMRAVTAGTPFGACTDIDPAAAGHAAGDLAETTTAAAAQLPAASPATRIFIAGMLARLSA